MQKDVIDDRYARLYELPNQLARQGHEVIGICFSYRKRKEGVFQHYQEAMSLLTWHSFNLGTWVIPGLSRFFYAVISLVRSYKPDVVLGSSDCLIVILTAMFCRLLKLPYFVDLYDNYESFGIAKIPGILLLYRWAIRHSSGVCCVSEPLSDYIRTKYGHQTVLTLESTIAGGDFYPMDKISARNAVGLPMSSTIIGVAGSLNKGRGIGLLYDSFLQLASKYPNLHMALAGPIDSTVPIPEHPRLHYLGLLPHKDIVSFYNALDLAVVCMRDTEFGRYAFPQKTYEILACKTPLLTAKLGALKHTFRDYPQCLYEPDNQADLQVKIEYLLEKPMSINIAIPTWQHQAAKFESWIKITLADKVA